MRVMLGALGPALGAPFLPCPGLTRCPVGRGLGGTDTTRSCSSGLHWPQRSAQLTPDGPILTAQSAKDEGGKGPRGISRRVSGTCLSEEETVPSFVPGLSRSSDSRPKPDKQVPAGLAASSLFLGGEERKGTAEDPSTSPLPSHRGRG